MPRSVVVALKEDQFTYPPIDLKRKSSQGNGPKRRFHTNIVLTDEGGMLVVKPCCQVHVDKTRSTNHTQSHGYPHAV